MQTANGVLLYAAESGTRCLDALAIHPEVNAHDKLCAAVPPSEETLMQTAKGVLHYTIGEGCSCGVEYCATSFNAGLCLRRGLPLLLP
jgi:hypothetical protein